MATDLTTINASNFVLGTVAIARLGTNAPSGTTFMRGDNSWQPLVASPAGSDTQIQYNAGGVLAASPNLTFNYSTNTLTATNLAGNGPSLTGLNASNITSGIFAPARLGTGTANTTTYLAGNATWQVPSPVLPSGSNMMVQFNNGPFGSNNGFLFNSTSTPPTVQTTGLIDSSPVLTNPSCRFRDTGSNVKGGFTSYGAPFGVLAAPCACGRLTLDPNHAAPLSDIGLTGTIYYLPCNGIYITLFNSNLNDYENIRVPDAGYSVSISSLPAGFMYDFFIQNNLDGTAQLVYGTAWTNSTTRAVNLAYTAGMLFNGTGTNQNLRYVGTIWIQVAGQTSDTASVRMIWNAYNQVPRKLLFHGYNPGGGSWNFTNPNSGTTVIRAVNGDDNGTRIWFVMGTSMIGVAGAQFLVLDSMTLCNLGTPNCAVYSGVALDQGPVVNFSGDIQSQFNTQQLSMLYNRFILPNNLGPGLHWFTMAEGLFNNSGAPATITFYTGCTSMTGYLLC